MRYVLVTSITLGCSSVLFGLARYFLHRRRMVKLLELIPSLEQKFWRPINEKVFDTNIRPCSIVFSEELIEDLKNRLKDAINKSENFNNSKYSLLLQLLLSHWLNKYDFYERNKFINKYPHYQTNIQGLDIHFVHIKPKEENLKARRVFPILLLHGWPSSIIEFYKLIPLLTTVNDNHGFVFEIIIPSLPGFGLSTAPIISGFSCVHMSVILKNLMLRLGHNKFYVHGGDWTACIVRVMSSLFPQHLMGMHSHLCVLLDKWDNVLSYLSLSEINKRVKALNKCLTEAAYFHVQTTSGTIGIGLNESPAALAVYVIEQFIIGTNLPQSEIPKRYTFDELIDNLMIYWVSKCISTSMQVYAQQFIEGKTKFYELLDSMTITVPCGLTQFIYKFMELPKLLKKRFTNLSRISYICRSGRFPALEEPECFAQEIWHSVDNMEIYAGVNDKKFWLWEDLKGLKEIPTCIWNYLISKKKEN